MDNNNKKLNVLALIALIIAGVSSILAILGTAFTCSCSASKTWSKDNLKNSLTAGQLEHKMSLVWILSLVAAIVAVAAVVLAIIALAKDRASKMAIVSLIIGVLAAAYAIIPMLTICSYNCAIDNAQKKLIEEQKNKNDEDDDDDFDIDWDF